MLEISTYSQKSSFVLLKKIYWSVNLVGVYSGVKFEKNPLEC